jgi:hypothetical protein
MPAEPNMSARPSGIDRQQHIRPVQLSPNHDRLRQSEPPAGFDEQRRWGSLVARRIWARRRDQIDRELYDILIALLEFFEQRDSIM